MHRLAKVLAVLGSMILATGVGATVSPPVDSAELEWTAVELPMAGARVRVPCSEAEIAAYKDGDSSLRHEPDFTGCVKNGNTTTVALMVNMADGLFDSIITGNASNNPVTEDLNGHRSFRFFHSKGRDTGAYMMVEIDRKNAVLLALLSENLDDEFRTLADSFFDSFEFVAL